MDDEIDDTLDEQEEFQEKLVGVLETGKDFEYVSGFKTSFSTQVLHHQISRNSPPPRHQDH